VRRTLVATALAAIVFALATPWALRPWFLAADTFPHDMSAASSMTDADLYLNVWILAWLAHAAVHAPARFFDGNVFYPAPDTIVGSENMLAHLPVTLPVLAATGNALAVLKAMALESFVLAGLGMFALVYRRTKDPLAAFVAGAAYTFTPLRVQTLPQPQYLGTQYLPFALLAVDILVSGGGRRAVLGLAAALALQALACVYVGYFTFLIVPVYAAARLLTTPGSRWLAVASGVLLAIGIAGAALVPVALPYLRGRSLGVIPPHDIEMIVRYAWAPWTWLTPAAFHKLGVVPMLIVAADLLTRIRRRVQRLPAAAGPDVALWTLVVLGVVLAAGPYLALGGWRLPLPYLAFHALVPGFSTVRAPLRFYVVVSAALSALAGIAFARTHGRLAWHPRALAAGVLAVCAVVHAAPVPASTMPARLGQHAPRVYRWLAAQTRSGVVLELPGPLAPGDVTGNLRNARYMVASTIHWHPIINGYTAYPPLTADVLTALARRLPDPDVLARLVDLVDVRWIVVHRLDLTAWEARAWRHGVAPGLRLAHTFGTDDVYEVTLVPPQPRREAFLDRAYTVQATTLDGTPTTALTPACRSGRILAVSPPEVMYPLPLPIAVDVRFENTSACPWPAFDVRTDGLVGLTYHWVSPSGLALPSGPFTRLIRDVAAHTTVADSMVIAPPAGEFGDWRCEIALVQQGEPRPIATTSVVVPLQPWPDLRPTKTM
jgi:hypothetical protein